MKWGLTVLASVAAAAAVSSGFVIAQDATSSADEKSLPHHFNGSVTEVNLDKNAFTIDLTNKKLVVVTDTQTKFFNYSGGLRSSSSFGAIKKDLRATVVGDIKGSTLTAKLVALIREKTTKPHVEAGKITAIGSTYISFEPAGKSGSTKSFSISGVTVYTEKVGDKIERIKVSDLSVGDRISFVGMISDSSAIAAKLVHVTSPTK